MNSRPTQCERLKEFFENGGSITQLEAYEKLGITRLGARVFELKNNQNIPIISETVKVKNRYGEVCRVKSYRLEGCK